VITIFSTLIKTKHAAFNEHALGNGHQEMNLEILG
jgi:hypothetical protein